MDLLFGRRKTPEELLRQNQRALNRAMRELDRERQKLETQEKKIIADIKKMAKQGQMDAVRIMAKDLVRTRRYVRKFVLMRANIQAVSLKIQTLKSNNSMAQAMKGVTKAMGTMNRQVCPSQSTFPSPLTFKQVTYPPCLLPAEITPDPEDHDGV
ncbi:chromatin modifying protein 2A, isoform CRA_a [Mus musculus]|nr:chromatin modifying protein 2A, isoform CRA_a [Mus musculus]